MEVPLNRVESLIVALDKLKSQLEESRLVTSNIGYEIGELENQLRECQGKCQYRLTFSLIYDGQIVKCQECLKEFIVSAS